MILKLPRFFKTISFFVLIALISVPSLNAQKFADAGDFDYSEVLRISVEFYDHQICGPQPSWSKSTWREPCHLNDGNDIGVNLTGGYHDAGDHTKFNYTFMQAARGLAWSYLEYPQSFVDVGIKEHLFHHLRHSGDFLIKLHPEPKKFYVQIGRARTGPDNDREHFEWRPAHEQSSNINRNVITVTGNNNGTGGAVQIAGSGAATFASLSMAFENEDVAYSNELLSHARDLFDFAEENTGDHYDLLGGEPYPTNDNDEDDLMIGAMWLYKATGEQQYLDKAIQYFGEMEFFDDWMMHYADHQQEGFLLLASETGQSRYFDAVERWLNRQIDESNHTNAGMYYRSDFLSAQLAATMGFAAYLYAEMRGSGFSNYTRYRRYAFRQMNYVLGDNPRGGSYVVGFGSNPPRITHHRSAHDSPNNDPLSPQFDTHVIEGAIIGGPRSDDSWNVDRNDVKFTEPAISNQAFFVGLAAQLVKEVGGGTPPPPPPSATEGSIEIENNFTVVNEAGSNASIGADSNNPDASNGQFVRLYDINDELSFSFDVSEAGDYRLDYRARVGQSSGTDSELADQYEIRVDGTVRNFNLVNSTISDLDGDTYWGIVRHTRNLSEGNHTISIKAESNWLKADRFDFALQTPSFDDAIIATTTPSSVNPGQEVTIAVEYSASTNRDIQVVFQINESPWTIYGSRTTAVSAGSGTINATFTIDENTPIANDAYQFQTFITDTGGGWPGQGNINKNNIDCVESQSGGGDTYYYIKNKATNRYVRPDHEGETAWLRVDDNDGTDWFKWKKVVSFQEFFYLQNKQTGMYFRPTGSADGARIEQRPTTFTGHWTQWKEVVSADGSSFHFENRATGKYIRPSNNTTNTNLELRPNTWTGDWTRWYFEDANGGSRTAELTSSSVALKVYPNPIHGGNFNVVVPSDIEGAVSIEIFNLTGKRVLSSVSDAGQTLEFSSKDLNPGMHILSIRKVTDGSILNTMKLSVSK